MKDHTRYSPVIAHANVEIVGWNASTPILEELARQGRGEKLWVRRGHNLVVLSGRNLIRSLLIPASGVSALTYFALGTDNTAVDDDDVALGVEVLRQPIVQYVASASALTLKYFLSSTQLNGTTIREAGLFNASTGPTMFARYVISPAIVKDNTVAVTFGWVITFTSS